ncbi:pseudouridine synthase [Comamonadaceae bacterium BS-T2-15]|uniref:Pseudouridine synthase n=1 Tax=Scleromatobacter humisilvae TaxID=2897159 RepID=A0A9X2C0X5_9BURK|nr:pseudouridine synthase [Scleromatobacter humisilvae]MCK9686941.1 pseudouridine synthase [Scleromatobacter humisilvae]
MTDGFAPPLRDGVAASRVGVADGRFATLLDFLAARFPAVADWPARLARGDVLDADGRALGADAPCAAGSLFWYWRDPPPEPRVPFDIELLHQDEHLVVVDKPHFLPVIPGGRHLRETVLVRLRQRLGIATLAPMHRLDRETAGVLVFTVRADERAAYHALLRERDVHKVYEAIAPWRADLALPLLARHRLEKPEGRGFMQVQVADGEPNAEALVELVERSDALALYRLTPRTGRTHQLRVQMSALGVPIVGDRIYPTLWPEPAADALPDWSNPLQLLAREIAFTDPVTGEARRFTSRRRLALTTGLPG